MKLNIKGLVFVGFAAAVFASAANADAGDKTVTSKAYVDGKYIAGTGITVTDNAQGKKVIATTADLTPYTASDGIALSEHNFTNSGVRTVSATDANGNDGTITVNTNGTSAEVAVKNVEVTSHKVQTVDGTSQTAAVDYPSVAAVAGLVGAAYTGQDGISVNSTTHVITNSGVRGVVASDANDAEGTIRLNVGGTETAYAVKNVEVTGNKASAIDDSGQSTDNSASTTEYTSNAAVTGYAQKKLSGTQGQLVTYGATAGTVGSATLGTADLTITKGGQTYQTFNANATTGVTIDIPNAPDIPTPASGTCTAEAPCALVWAGGTTPTWEPIQQPVTE
jgi:hypothetical protein